MKNRRVDKETKTLHTEVMKKKTVRRRTKRKQNKQTVDYMVVVRSWMLIVLFALMLGVGAIIGNYINVHLAEGVPTVAGSSVELR
jgi:site-specific recombinase